MNQLSNILIIHSIPFLVPAELLKPGPASRKRRLLDRHYDQQKETEQDKNKKPKIVLIPIEIEKRNSLPPTLIDVTTTPPIARKPQPEPPVIDMELEQIKSQLRWRKLPVRPGPKSRVKATLERVKRQEDLVTCPWLAIKACPASKKEKYVAKIVANYKAERQKGTLSTAKGDQREHQRQDQGEWRREFE